MIRRLFSPGEHGPAGSVGLLLLRIGVGAMLLGGHGWNKLQNYGEMSENFGDPLGIGPQLSLIGAIAGEALGSVLIILGFGTRIGALLMAFTMGVAAFIFHSADAFEVKEKALLYFVPALTLMFTGAGAISVDQMIGGTRRS